jgi:hypothetical protein
MDNSNSNKRANERDGGRIIVVAESEADKERGRPKSPGTWTSKESRSVEVKSPGAACTSKDSRSVDVKEFRSGVDVQRVQERGRPGAWTSKGSRSVDVQRVQECGRPKSPGRGRPKSPGAWK